MLMASLKLKVMTENDEFYFFLFFPRKVAINMEYFSFEIDVEELNCDWGN